MAETTAVFDPNVFDAIFDSTDVIPAISKVRVEPTYGRIAAGQAVSVTIYVINNTTSPGRIYPLSPSEEPLIQLFTPSDIPLGTAQPMSQTGDGIFSYTYSTDSTDIKGPYSAIFTLTNGLLESVSKKQVAFTII